MSSRRSALYLLVCVLELTPGMTACGGNSQAEGAAGAAAQGGASGGNLGSGGARAGAAGALAAGASGAAAAGAAAGGAATGGAATGGAATGGAATGGAASAGAPAAGAPAAGAPAGGSNAGGASGVGGAGGAAGCSGLSQTRSARSGKSTGFAGGYMDKYYPLYSHACSAVSDCSAACVTAGGTQASCAASDCVDSTPDYCLPPTYWFDFDKLLTEGNSEESSVWIIMVNNPYRDTLQASNFQFEIPSGAKILGISFAFNEAADSQNMIGDYSVRALANSAAVGLDRGHSTAWTTNFHSEIYGGAADLWGTTWTADAVNAPGFGVALTPLYLDTAGNARAYVDFIRATVTYDTCQ